MCQLTEPELGGSTTAARVLRQANGCSCFRRHAASVAAYGSVTLFLKKRWSSIWTGAVAKLFIGAW
jgi:hypothetical protein